MSEEDIRLIAREENQEIIAQYTKDIFEKNNRIIEQNEEIERLKIIEEKYKDSQLYIKDFKDEIEQLTISLQAQEELTISWYNKTKEQDKEIERLNNIIKEVREYIEENQEEHKYTDRGGFTYTEGHFLRDSDTLLEILDKGE